MDLSNVQNKINALPYFVRLCLRAGFIIIPDIPLTVAFCIAPDIFDIMLIIMMTGHGITTGILLYTNLDLRTDEEQSWEKYRRSLFIENIIAIIGLMIIAFLKLVWKEI